MLREEAPAIDLEGMVSEKRPEVPGLCYGLRQPRALGFAVYLPKDYQPLHRGHRQARLCSSPVSRAFLLLENSSIVSLDFALHFILGVIIEGYESINK